MELLRAVGREDASLAQVVKGVNLQDGPLVGGDDTAQRKLNAGTILELLLAVDVRGGQTTNPRVIYHVLEVHHEILVGHRTQQHIDLDAESIKNQKRGKMRQT